MQTPFVHPAIARLRLADRDLFTTLTRAGRGAPQVCLNAGELAAHVGTTVTQLHDRLSRLEQTRIVSSTICTCTAQPHMHLRIAFAPPPSLPAQQESTLVHKRPARRLPQRVPKARVRAQARLRTLDVLKQRAQGQSSVCFVAKSLLPGVSREALKPRLRELRDQLLITVERCACRDFQSVHTRVTLLPASGHRVAQPPPADSAQSSVGNVRQTARSFAHSLLARHADRELTLNEINEQLPAITRYDRSTLKTALHELERLGLVEWYRGPGDRSAYWRITAGGLAVKLPATIAP